MIFKIIYKAALSRLFCIRILGVYIMVQVRENTGLVCEFDPKKIIASISKVTPGMEMSNTPEWIGFPDGD